MNGSTKRGVSIRILNEGEEKAHNITFTAADVERLYGLTSVVFNQDKSQRNVSKEDAIWVWQLEQKFEECNFPFFFGLRVISNHIYRNNCGVCGDNTLINHDDC